VKSTMLKVLVAAPTHDLTTLENVYEELGITDDTHDNRMARWISATSAAIEKWCNRVFALEQVVETWRATDGWTVHDTYYPDALHLARRPIVQIDSVVEDLSEPLTTDDYEFDAENGQLWRLSGGIRRDWCLSRVTVTYSGGYDVPEHTPFDLEQACLMLLKIRNDGITRDRSLRALTIPGVLEEQFQTPTGTGGGMSGGLAPEVCTILDAWRDYNPP